MPALKINRDIADTTSKGRKYKLCRFVTVQPYLIFADTVYAVYGGNHENSILVANRVHNFSICRGYAWDIFKKTDEISREIHHCNYELEITERTILDAKAKKMAAETSGNPRAKEEEEVVMGYIVRAA